MDRRSFIALGAGSAAATLLGTGVGHASLRRPTELLWAADLSTASDSYGAGFGNVQVQYGGGEIENDGPGMPVVEHPKLGRALEIALEENQSRWEAAPGAGDGIGEGDVLFFRVDFVLDPNFPVDQGDPFCAVNQVHQGSSSGSPPLELDIANGALYARGASDAYNEELSPVVVDTVYKLVYGVAFSAEEGGSVLNVWLNDKQVLTEFAVPCPMIDGGDSYWKGATMYCSSDIPPLTVYQNAHRVGTTYEAVAN